MLETVIHFLKGLPVEAVTAIIATLPIFELRGAIPWAHAATDLSWQTIYLYAVLGNFLPVLPLLYLLEPVSTWLRRFRLFDRFFEWLFARTRKRGKMIERYEALGLILFVGIPLPVTGAWTGTVAAFIFGISKKWAIPCIMAGILLSGAIVTLVVLGGSSLFQIVK